MCLVCTSCYSCISYQDYNSRYIDNSQGKKEAPGMLNSICSFKGHILTPSNCSQLQNSPLTSKESGFSSYCFYSLLIWFCTLTANVSGLQPDLEKERESLWILLLFPFNRAQSDLNQIKSQGQIHPCCKPQWSYNRGELAPCFKIIKCLCY